MEENHISQEEWTQFFSARQHTAQQMKLQSRILMHTGQCGRCRDVYEKGMALRRAAQAYSELETPLAADGAAYRAVASSQDAKAAKKNGGSLTVDIDAGAGCFMEDTLDTVGCANKYALNPEDGGRRLVDDGGELSLVLEDRAVKVCFQDDSLCMEGHLLTEEGSVPLDFARGQGKAALPQDDFCTLELLLSE